MTAQQFKQITLEYRQKLIGFAAKFIPDEWAEMLAGDALFAAFKENPEDVKTFLYNTLGIAVAKYLKAHGKTLSMEQISELVFDKNIVS